MSPQRGNADKKTTNAIPYSDLNTNETYHQKPQKICRHGPEMPTSQRPDRSKVPTTADFKWLT